MNTSKLIFTIIIYQRLYGTIIFILYRIEIFMVIYPFSCYFIMT